MDELFETVRGGCSPRTWSRAVELARGDAVSARGDVDTNADEGELTLAVQVPGRMVNPTVILQLDDEDWSCDCEGQADPCEHVAAAVIALRRARRSGKPLARATAKEGPATGTARVEDRPRPARGARGLPRVAYRFTRTGDGKLRFERVLVAAASGAERPLRQPLTALIGARGGGRAGPAKVLASAEDLAVDRALGLQPPRWITGQRMLSLLAALDGCREVTLDGQPVEIDGEPVQLRARVEDAAEGGFILRASHTEATDEIFDNGAVRVGQALRPVGETPLSRAELQRLAAGRRFSPAEATELATRVLPALEARMPVELRSRRLPRASRTPPGSASTPTPPASG